MTRYLTTTPTPVRLHDRLAILWASSSLSGLLSDDARRALIAETLAKQGADGGWSNEALGPWMAPPDAPASSGSNAYATAFTAFALHKGGVKPSHAVAITVPAPTSTARSSRGPTRRRAAATPHASRLHHVRLPIPTPARWWRRLAS